MGTFSIKLIALVVAVSACVLSQSVAQTNREAAESLLRKAFGGQTMTSAKTIMLSIAEKESMRAEIGANLQQDSLEVLCAFHEQDIAGYAVVDNVRGKDQPITYCVIVDKQLAVKNVEILEYREPYGGEVRNARWLSQFQGKQPSDKLRPGRDIKVITGATISSRSVTFGVQKILSLLRIVQSRLPHQRGPNK